MDKREPADRLDLAIGDAPGVVLSDGTFMLGNCCTSQAALLNPKDLTWTSIGTGKFDTNNEEGWTLLPNNRVRSTVDAYSPIGISFESDGHNSEIFDPPPAVAQSAAPYHSSGIVVVVR